MKTAVEWLIDTINKINHNYEVGIIDETLWSIQTYDAHKQAKEIEKEQIKFFFKKGHLYSGCPYGLEECYKKTFKSE